MKDQKEVKESECKRRGALCALFGPDLHLAELFFTTEGRAYRQRAELLDHEIGRDDLAARFKLKAALDIWSGNGYLYLFEMLEHWDRITWLDFIRSIARLKDIELADFFYEDLDQSEESLDHLLELF